jgi:hypothetical protein
MNDVLTDIKNLEQVANALSVSDNTLLGLELLQRMIDVKKNEVEEFEMLYEEDGA